MKGGAYGCGASYNSHRGTFSLASYRDPNVGETLRVYDGVCDYIEKEMDLSSTGVEQAIIGSVKNLDRPIRPEQAVEMALARYLGGIADEKIREFRDRLFRLTGEDIRRVSAEVLRPAVADSSTCVIASREKLEAANRSRDIPLAISDL